MQWRFRYWDDPVLRKHCEPVEEITDEIRSLALFMIDYADNHNGIGLAAPQVGVSLRLFVLRDYITLPDGERGVSAPKIFINPKILWKSEEIESHNEGCLSFPGLELGPIERPTEVHIEATDLEGNRFVDKRKGWNARVAFHENDHINGVLYIDRIPAKIRKEIEPELQAIKKEYQI